MCVLCCDSPRILLKVANCPDILNCLNFRVRTFLLTIFVVPACRVPGLVSHTGKRQWICWCLRTSPSQQQCYIMWRHCQETEITNLDLGFQSQIPANNGTIAVMFITGRNCRLTSTCFRIIFSQVLTSWNFKGDFWGAILGFHFWGKLVSMVIVFRVVQICWRYFFPQTSQKSPQFWLVLTCSPEQSNSSLSDFTQTLECLRRELDTATIYKHSICGLTGLWSASTGTIGNYSQLIRGECKQQICSWDSDYLWGFDNDGILSGWLPCSYWKEWAFYFVAMQTPYWWLRLDSHMFRSDAALIQKLVCADISEDQHETCFNDQNKLCGSYLNMS